MNFEKPPVHPWEMMAGSKRALGQTAFQQLLGVGTTQANRYCRNPNFTADSENSPLVRLRNLFEELRDIGSVDQVRQMVNYLAESIGEHVSACPVAEPDKKTVADECLDDLPTLALVHELCRSGEHPRVVRDAFDKLVAEVAQDLTLYERKWQEGNQ